jgi:hypothetical protein
LDNYGNASLIYLVGAIIAAAIVIVVAVVGISYGLYHLTGTEAAGETLNNYANAQQEQVVFTEYRPGLTGQGNWDGYYLSSDGRRFYTNSKIASQNFELQAGYSLLSYKIVLNGFPDNSWGIKEVTGMVQPPTEE